jgi:hypothetical protein
MKSQIFVVLCYVDQKRFETFSSVTFIRRVNQLNILFLTDGPWVWTKHAPSKRQYLFTREHSAEHKKTAYWEIEISQLYNITIFNNIWNQVLISH